MSVSFGAMDQRAGEEEEEEEEERNSEDSSDHRRKDEVDAAAAAAAEGPGMNNHGERESMDHQRVGGHEEAEEETDGVLKEVDVVQVELVGGSEEASAPPLVAHPCSLLQLLLRACAGCLDLHGYFSDDDDVPAAAAAESPKEGEGGGDKATSEEGTQVRAAVRRRPSPPRRPREGPGGDGGSHH